MTNSAYSSSYNKINQLVKSSRLNEAFGLLKSFALSFSLPKNEREKMENLENTYRYLLDYMAKGFDDPSQQQVIDDISEGLYRCNDLILKASLLPDSRDVYSTAKRMENHKESSFHYRAEELLSAYENLGNPETSSQYYMALNNLFSYVWTMFGAPAEEYDAISSFLSDTDKPEDAKALIVSALLLDNIQYYDAYAFSVLLDAYESTISLKLKARVIVAISLILFIHSSRILKNVALKSRIMLMKEDPEMNSLFNFLIEETVRTYDTQRVTTRMREEVIPGLMKINPDIIEKMRNLASDSEDFLSESNPEWEEIIEQSGVQDKIQEINDMQLEGSDVMMTTFSNLKGFPFFQNISGWFLPFDSSHPDIRELAALGSEDFSRFTLAMCDSDVYSFLLSMKNLPQSHREMMLKNIDNQMKQAQEVMTSAVGDTDKTILKREIRHSLQDLYRFFKLFRRKEDFTDPFLQPLDGETIRPLISLIGVRNESLHKIADFYFKHQYFLEAASIYELIDSLQNGDFSLWERIGFCYDRSKRFETAISWYKKAEFVNPSSNWLEKKLAVCLKNSGNLSEALTYYERVLQNEPDNFHLLMSAGQCLVDKKDYQNALQHFYHAEYLNPGKISAQRAIAWCLLMNHDLDKAMTAFDNLVSSPESDSSDLLNAALCALAMNNISNALGYYSRFLELTGTKDFRALMTALRDDAAALKELDISTKKLRLVIDKLRYDSLS